jgi:hypothetical protein
MVYVDSSAGFPGVLDFLSRMMTEAPEVCQDRWQGFDVRGRPDARCYELRNVCFEADLQGIEDLGIWKSEIRPNLPWADDHFAERVGGEPLNPGVQWRNWPWGRSADRFRRPDEKFNHTYLERLWPRWARRTPGGRFTADSPRPADEGLRGIDRRVGDLDDLVDLLVRDPPTRQAWIPLFFPEDTGWGDGGRKMCSLGYQLLLRDGRLHLWYPLRSCDFAHHLRDDLYLAVRMLLWVLGRCRAADRATWGPVVPGTLGFHATSLHIFEADALRLRKEYTV